MTALIASGSLTTAVLPDQFGLPQGTALRCDRPARALRDLVTGYFLMDSAPTYRPAGTEWMLPAGAQIWVGLTAGPISVSIGRRRYHPIPTILLYGPTSRAMPITSSGGRTLGIELSPLGWARFIAASAETLRDQLLPLASVVPQPVVTELATSLARSDRDRDTSDILDAFFLRHLTEPHRDEALIIKIMQLLADRELISTAAACAAHDLEPRAAARIARRYFGFPLKTLMLKARFLRAITLILESGRPDLLPTGYYDQSHLLRDAKRFLGMTPRQFLAQRADYVTAVCRARRLVLGAPVHALDCAPDR